MPEYIPSPREWVRDQVELYESSGGTKGTTLRDTGLPVIIVTHSGNKTGAIRKTPLMRVKDGDHYVLVASLGGAPKNRSGCTTLRQSAGRDPRRDDGVPDARARGHGCVRAGSPVGAVGRGVPALRGPSDAHDPADSAFRSRAVDLAMRHTNVAAQCSRAASAAND